MLKPVGSYILIKPAVKPKTKSVGGIVVPYGSTNEDKDPATATIIGFGEDVEDISNASYKEYSTIVYDRYAGFDVTCDDEKYKIIEKKDILAVINK